jgi:hypothetical protein
MGGAVRYAVRDVRIVNAPDPSSTAKGWAPKRQAHRKMVAADVRSIEVGYLVVMPFAIRTALASAS